MPLPFINGPNHKQNKHNKTFAYLFTRRLRPHQVSGRGVTHSDMTVGFPGASRRVASFAQWRRATAKTCKALPRIRRALPRRRGQCASAAAMVMSL